MSEPCPACGNEQWRTPHNCTDGPPRTRKYLKVVYDVTGFTEDEIAGLDMEAAVQGEASERHPDVAGETQSFVFDDALKSVHEAAQKDINLWTRMYLDRKEPA